MRYLDEKYRDDDIGPECKDHIRDSKEFLANIFKRNPTIQIEVIKVVTRDNVVSAYLEWSVEANGKKKVIRKGIGIFVVKDKKILKRHTFIYFNE
jgi:predicted SnoaL-like aldol condensation-catalyzing enzyme